jgi:xylulokinase
MNIPKIIAYDLGTGGIKASIFDIEGKLYSDTFIQYETSYNGKFHEQAPNCWWDGIIQSTKKLIGDSKAFARDIVGMAISGHSLGVVPVGKDGELLRAQTPIWSDARAEVQAKRFFEKIDYNKWYMTTGNGFPAELYSIFKIMWYKEFEPEMYSNIYKIIGSKDYCNLRLTGKIYTDHSYASGSGVYSLKERKYIDEYLKAAEIEKDFFPEIIGSHDIVGHLTSEAANILGLSVDVKVIAGGVDNSCMALGSKGIKDGRAYLSLGSSSWIAAIGEEPILDIKYKPFVFTHVVEGLFTSATSIFAAGSSFRWVRDTICSDLVAKEVNGEIEDAYILMNEMVGKSPIGANRLIFNPSLAGGAMIEETKNICGGFVGLSLSHNRNDMVRSAMEGITYNLNYAMEILKKYKSNISEILLVGGGSKSQIWRQMFADVFGMDIIKSCIDQNAASLGVAALVAFGLGYWKSYDKVDEIHIVQNVESPNMNDHKKYMEMYRLHRYIAHFMALSGDKLVNNVSI